MKKVLLYIILVSLVVGGVTSCKYLKGRTHTTDEHVLARVGSESLYPSDVTGLQTGMTAKDSAGFIANYAESWTRRKLLLRKAEQYVPVDELGIEKKVEDYRQSLILYEYEKELINQKLDKAIPQQEIADFYEKNKANFTLESDIYDVQYMRLPLTAPDLDKMKPLLLAPKNEDETRRRDGYCKAEAKTYSLDTNHWVGISSLLKLLPITAEELQAAAATHKYTELKTDKELLILHINGIKHTGEPAPLDFISDQLKEILINKKKVVLIRRIYDRIYEEGLKNGECEILVKK